MSDPNEPCIACAIARGATRPPGGVLARERGLVLHGFAGPAPLRGWLVVTTERHARALYDLDDAELATLGPFVVRAMRAQRAVLGAEHVYAMAIGDVLRHFHMHLVPRFPETPERLRGWRVFGATAEDARPLEEIEIAAEAVRRALEAEAGRG